jgi:hypothetical protein
MTRLSLSARIRFSGAFCSGAFCRREAKRPMLDKRQVLLAFLGFLGVRLSRVPGSYYISEPRPHKTNGLIECVRIDNHDVSSLNKLRLLLALGRQATDANPLLSSNCFLSSPPYFMRLPTFHHCQLNALIEFIAFLPVSLSPNFLGPFHLPAL